jgi:hypothetical protein
VVRGLLGTAVAAAAVVVPTAAASAHGGPGWIPLTFPDGEAACGATTVHAAFLRQHLSGKETVLADGTLFFDLSGTSTALLTTDAGASVSVQQAGPARNTVYANGDFETSGTGTGLFAVTPDLVGPLGLPSQIALISGPYDAKFTTAGASTWVVKPNRIIDLCAKLVPR